MIRRPSLFARTACLVGYVLCPVFCVVVAWVATEFGLGLADIPGLGRGQATTRAFILVITIALDAWLFVTAISWLCGWQKLEDRARDLDYAIWRWTRCEESLFCLQNILVAAAALGATLWFLARMAVIATR